MPSVYQGIATMAAAEPGGIIDSDNSDQNSHHIVRWSRLSIGMLILLSAMPDAAVIPVLRELLIGREGVSVGLAHAFMTINLLGALVAIRFLPRLIKKLGAPKLIIYAAIADAIFLGLISAPIGLPAMLTLRCFEGAADLFVYAVLFNAMGRAGPVKSRGQRMGIAGTCLMLGVASGLGLGGVVGSVDPRAALWLGAGACLVVALLAFMKRSTLDTTESSPKPAPHDASHPTQPKPLWPALVMMFSDRALSGVLVTTVPLYLTSLPGIGPRQAGGYLGSCMLAMALGAWPAGWLIDRVGVLGLRRAATIVFGVSFAGLTFAASSGPIALILLLMATGFAGAALLTTSLQLVMMSNTGAAGMGAYHSAGNVGAFIGPVTVGASLMVLSQGEISSSVYAVTFAVLSIVYIIIASSATLAVRSRQAGLVQPSPLDRVPGPELA